MLQKVNNPNETLDDLEFKGLKIFQHKNGYKFSTDSVLLANFAKASKNDTIVDFCSGSGVVTILFACKNNVKKAYGIEIQKDLAELSKKSIEFNGLKNIEILNIDLKKTHNVLGYETVDVISVNPPYNTAGATSGTDEIAIATHELKTNLKTICDEASKLLKFGGKIYMVHRADRLADILFELKSSKIEPKVLRMVYPKKNKDPNLVLIEAKKGAKPGLKFLPPLILNNDDGSETDELKQIYGRK